MLKYINNTTNSQEEYGYACARIRELENNLLNKNIIRKMIDSPNLEKALKVLTENNLNEYSFESTDLYTINSVLNNILKKTIDIINNISPDPHLFHLFRCEYDLHNLKVLLKAKVLNKKEPYPLYDIGNINSQSLFAAVFEEKFQSVPVKIERIIKQSGAEYLKSEDLQLMEIVLDQGYYEIIFDQLEKINQAFFFYFYKSKLDLLNFTIACRCKIRNIEKSKLAEILLKQGYLPIEKIMNLYDNSILSWPNSYKNNEYHSVFEEGIKHWQKESNLLKLEQLSDDFLLNLLKIGKYTTFGPESIIAYYYAKENDLKNIRIISNAKRYGFDNKIIQKYIRDTYV